MKQGCRIHRVSSRLLTFVVTGTFTMLGLGQSAFGAQEFPVSLMGSAQPLDTVAVTTVPPLDYKAIVREDIDRQAQGLPLRFAIPNATDINPLTHGTWEKINATTMVWRLRVDCPNAVSMNLGFTDFFLPNGATLFLLNGKNHGDFVRPITSADNRDFNEFWTPVVIANEIVVELTIPEVQIPQLRLTIGSINAGYWDFTNTAARDREGDEGGIASTGGCEIDTICSQGDAWRSEIQSVARIVIQGSFLCSGWMTNNTANDKKNYFMTANHCGLTAGNAGTLVTYWNYQNSFCRALSGCGDGCVPPGNGSLSSFISGSTFRAAFAPSDVTLCELVTSPNPSWQISYAGWDRSGNSSPSGAGIHHPQGEEKRICLYSSSAFPTSYGGNFSPGDGSHVRVQWSQGVTEGGSSGSPIFDSAKRVIGQLHGGGSFCTNPFAPDWYGRFAMSWTGGGTNSTRLSNWLDPLNSAPIVLDTLSGLAPANDGCSGAILVPTGSTVFSTTTATTEGFGEINCGFAGGNLIERDIWFRWLPPCTGTATVSVCGATFNTRIAAYIGCPAGTGATIACDDNFCGTASQMSFPVTQNQIHRIRIGGFQNSAGTGTLVVSCTPAPPACPEDVNNSGSVNIDDLVIVITNWGATSGPADINDDNIVNIDDLVLIITGWGPC